MNREDFHPFWQGVFSEMGKQAGDIAALPGQAAQFATQSPETAAALGGGALLAGIGAVALKRKLSPKKAPKMTPPPDPTPAPEPPPQGWSGRALLGTGLAAGGLGYYYGSKRRD